MRFAYFCFDRGDQMAARNERLMAHLHYMEQIADQIMIAGPIPGPAGGPRFAGSVIIYNVGSREEADALFNNDPYASANLWERVEVVPFSEALGTAIGGLTWEIVNGDLKMKQPA